MVSPLQELEKARKKRRPVSLVEEEKATFRRRAEDFQPAFRGIGEERIRRSFEAFERRKAPRFGIGAAPETPGVAFQDILARQPEPRPVRALPGQPPRIPFAPDFMGRIERAVAETPSDILDELRANARRLRGLGYKDIRGNPVDVETYVRHEVGEKMLVAEGVPSEQVHRIISQLYPAGEVIQSQQFPLDLQEPLAFPATAGTTAALLPRTDPSFIKRTLTGETTRPFREQVTQAFARTGEELLRKFHIDDVNLAAPSFSVDAALRELGVNPDLIRPLAEEYSAIIQRESEGETGLGKRRRQLRPAANFLRDVRELVRNPPPEGMQGLAGAIAGGLLTLGGAEPRTPEEMLGVLETLAFSTPFGSGVFAPVLRGLGQAGTAGTRLALAETGAGISRAIERAPVSTLTRDVRGVAAELSTRAGALGRGTAGRLAEFTDDVFRAIRADDPSPPPATSPWGRAGRPPPQGAADDAFMRIRRDRIPFEKPDRTLLRRHSGLLNQAENEAAAIVDTGNQALRRMGIGRFRKGRLVPRQQDIEPMDQLYDALHNPSRVDAGDLLIPEGFESQYRQLRDLTDWEQAFRLDSDPAMRTVEDYFYRGWLAPEGVPTAAEMGRGRLGVRPPFRQPRVDATYREMRDSGFEPLSWNPYEQWKLSRIQGVRYRQQMQLIDDLKKREIAVPHAGGPVEEGMRTPRVGPAFEGKPYASVDSAGNARPYFTKRYIVPDETATLLENIYGVPPDLGKVHVGGRAIDVMEAIDTVVFIPKQAKLFGSFFQHIDFMQRNYVGAWAGMVDALQAGQPLEAVRRLAIWPKSAGEIMYNYLTPGGRNRILQTLNSTDPILAGRPGVHFKGITEAGLSTTDPTIFNPGLDRVARTVAEEMGLAKVKAVGRMVTEFESLMRRRLFGVWYPGAMITDIRNNIAPMLARMFPDATDEALNGAIAYITNIKYSTVPGWQTFFQNRAFRESFRRIAFSLAEPEGLVRQGAGVVKGPYKGYWVKHWVGAWLGLITMANMIHYASTGEMLPFRRWTPISKAFWHALPFGYSSSFAAPTIPVRGREGFRLTIDLVGQLDTVFRVLDPFGFVQARESVPIRAVLTQIEGETFTEMPIDTVGPGGIVSRTAQLIQDVLAPIGPGQTGLQIIREKIPGLGPLIPAVEQRLGGAGHAIQAIGINLRAELKSEMLNRVSRDKYKGKEYQDLNPFQQEAVRREVEGALEIVESERRLRQDDYQVRFVDVYEGYQTRYHDQAEAMAAQFKGRELREKLDTIQRDFIRDVLNLRQNESTTLKFLDELDAPEEPVRKAIDRYFEIMNADPPLEDPLTLVFNYRDFEDREQQVKDDPTAGPYWEQILRYLDENDPQPIRELRAARRFLEPYWDIEPDHIERLRDLKDSAGWTLIDAYEEYLQKSGRADKERFLRSHEVLDAVLTKDVPKIKEHFRKTEDPQYERLLYRYGYITSPLNETFKNELVSEVERELVGVTP